MYFEPLMASAAISRLAEEWQPDRRPRATLRPLAQRRRRHDFRVLHAVAIGLLRTGPER
jgi:hypothetical protein